MVSLKSHIRKLSNHWFWVLLVIMLQGNIGFAQVNPECFEGINGSEGTYHDLHTDFEDNHVHSAPITSAINPWVIDSSIQNNLWQIGVPQKLFLDSAYTKPNGLITDTLLPYPSNNRSVFYAKFCSSFYPYPLKLSGILFGFRCKFNTDTLKDGFFIEVSYNGGNTWKNVLYDETPMTMMFYRFYEASDSLYNGESGFSGSSYGSVSNINGWASPSFLLTFGEETNVPFESVMFRFVFISDSIDNQLDGIVIDDLRINICGFWNNIDGLDLNNAFSLFPNPTTEKVQLKLDEKFLNKDNKLILSNVFGQKLLEQNMPEAETTLDVSFLERGVYFLQMESSGYKSTKKLVIN